jgi:hypothetical protein
LISGATADKSCPGPPVIGIRRSIPADPGRRELHVDDCGQRVPWLSRYDPGRIAERALAQPGSESPLGHSCDVPGHRSQVSGTAFMCGLWCVVPVGGEGQALHQKSAVGDDPDVQVVTRSRTGVQA